MTNYYDVRRDYAYRVVDAEGRIHAGFESKREALDCAEQMEVNLTRRNKMTVQPKSAPVISAKQRANFRRKKEEDE